MSRPIKRRNVKSYSRDIESLGRLRTAIIMDTTLDWTNASEAVEQIDRLVKCMVKLHSSIQQKSA